MFPVFSAGFRALRLGPGKLRGPKQPACENGRGRKARRLLRQRNEDGLRRLLRQMRLLHLPQRGGINHVHMTLDQNPKRRFGFIRDILAQQFDVFAFHVHVTCLCCKTPGAGERSQDFTRSSLS